MQVEAVNRTDTAYGLQKPTIVAFANAQTLNVALNDQSFREVRIGVAAASRILFRSFFPLNLNGTDFTPYYFGNTRHNYHIFFFLDGSSGVAERATTRLIAMCGPPHDRWLPQGYSGAEDAMAIVAKVVAPEADVLLVAMGNPLQELWLSEHLQATGCRLV
jgi:UDP-N-acetyl-D-mannosaminuronic acid transferase (WecB/TagA/CpsF family)